MAEIRLFKMEQGSVKKWREALLSQNWIVFHHEPVFMSSEESHLLSFRKDEVLVDIFTQSELSIELAPTEIGFLVWALTPSVFQKVILRKKNILYECVSGLISDFGGREIREAGDLKRLGK